MKRKPLIIWITLLLIVVLSLVGIRCYWAYRYKSTAELITSDNYALRGQQSMPMWYEDETGYFPHSLDEAIALYKQVVWPDDPSVTEKTLRMQQLLTDRFSKDGEEIQYIPLYDYYTRRPASFILLSAGIDGKLDNHISASDTIYLQTWWTQLDVYNYEGAVLMHDYCQQLFDLGKISEDKSNSIVDKNRIVEFYPPSPQLAPPFCLKDYLWGKKDWIIQLGPFYPYY